MPGRSQDLLRDFIRFRQNAAFGWPDKTICSPSDLSYFDMLETERLAGRLEIQGETINADDAVKLEAELFG